jgi:serine/threonine protein phosphatase PrpC
VGRIPAEERPSYEASLVAITRTSFDRTFVAFASIQWGAQAQREIVMHDSGEEDTAEFAVQPSEKRGHREPYSGAVQVDLYGLTHLGKVRPNNEDHFLICRFGRFLEPVQTSLPADAVPQRSEERGYGMVVADGIGGASAGEEASRLAISSLIDLVLRTPDWILRLDGNHLPEEVLRRASERYEQINLSLQEEARQIPSLSGFGTTMTMAWSLGSDLFLAHIGDSRAYLLSGGLRQLTRDHTGVQQLVDQRLIDRRDAATHHLRHALTQCLGDHSRQARPDVTRLEIADNDRLLLCTDGLTDMVDLVTIAEILAGDEPAQVIAQRLVDKALSAGGKDNVTVVVARYQGCVASSSNQ